MSIILRKNYRLVRAWLILAGVVGGSISLVVALYSEATLPALEPGSTIPDLSLTTTQGATATLHRILRGSSLLVLFSTGCQHCRAFLSDLSDLPFTQHDLPDIIGLSLSPAKETRLWETNRTSSFPVYIISSSQASRSLGIRAVPALILLRDTLVQRVFTGKEIPDTALFRELRTHALITGVP